jgi:hypothetical protein
MLEAQLVLTTLALVAAALAAEPTLAAQAVQESSISVEECLDLL